MSMCLIRVFLTCGLGFPDLVLVAFKKIFLDVSVGSAQESGP